jgi:myo-inositol-1(or 4)-monophosphatase
VSGPDDWHEAAVRLARWASATIAASRPDPAQAETKVNAGDWVTSIDREVERHVRAELHRSFPGHLVIGEEYGADPGTGSADPQAGHPADQRAGGGADEAGAGEVTWYLDPIDGTTNFVHGVPWVSFTLAARDERGPVVGVVADAHRGEVFAAVRGHGATLNGAPLRCAGDAAITGGVVLTEWSRQDAWPGMYDYLTRVSARHGATRIMGSCALALATVAAGRAAGAVLPGHYNAWDVTAGVLIAREAGAEVYDRAGPHDDVPMNGLLVAAPKAADELWRCWTGEGEAGIEDGGGAW